jgi:hypothetical protein
MRDYSKLNFRFNQQNAHVECDDPSIYVHTVGGQSHYRVMRLSWGDRALLIQGTVKQETENGIFLIRWTITSLNGASVTYKSIGVNDPDTLREAVEIIKQALYYHNGFGFGDNIRVVSVQLSDDVKNFLDSKN